MIGIFFSLFILSAAAAAAAIHTLDCDPFFHSPWQIVRARKSFRLCTSEYQNGKKKGIEKTFFPSSFVL